MKTFTHYLTTSQRPEWTDFYINYAELKNLLEKFVERRGKLSSAQTNDEIERERFYPETLCSSKSLSMPDQVDDFVLMGREPEAKYPKRGVNEKISEIEREEFCWLLDDEVNKVVGHYLRQIRINTDALDQIELQFKKEDIDEENKQLSSKRFKNIGRELVELYIFVGANLIALKQILIRYDGLVRTLDAGAPIAQWYILTRRENLVEGNFEELFIHHRLFLLLNRWEALIKDSQSSGSYDDSDQCIVFYNRQVEEIENVITKAEQVAGTSSGGRMPFTDGLVYTIRYYFLSGSTMNELLLQPNYVRTRGKMLKNEMKFLSKQRNRVPTPLAVEHLDRKKKDTIFHASLILNISSQFLYTMNHYIIEPSSTTYIHELGGHDALAGLLIGMSPWAAILSAILYSVWSNRSFREPLLCSACFLIAGSLMYASALKFNSIPLAMFGRFMTGMGAPCGINIRYIADTVKMSDRTSASAILTTASALGMSLGPGCAVLLAFLDIEVYIPILGNIKVNAMTAPGYLMFILWSIYACFLYFFFQDGARTGLEEMIEKSKQEEKKLYVPPETTLYSDIIKSFSTFEDSRCTDIYTEDGLVEEGTNENKITRLLNQATIIMMILKFSGKLCLEIFGCSVSLLSRHRYDWDMQAIGMLSFVNGCLVVPLTTAVGYFSRYHTDRELLLYLLGIAWLGIFLLIDFTDFGDFPDENGYNDDIAASVGPYRYILGIVLEFCGLQASQCVILSILSKVVPTSLARGTFNSGFIATTLATFARASGDLLITLFGLVSLRHLLNLLAVPCLLLLSASLMLTHLYRHKITV